MLNVLKKIKIILFVNKLRQKTKSKTYGTNHTRSLKHNLNLGLEAGSSDSSLILVVPCQLSPMIKIPHPPLSHYLSIY